MTSLETIALILSGANGPALDYVDTSVQQTASEDKKPVCVGSNLQNCGQDFEVFGVAVNVADQVNGQSDTGSGIELEETEVNTAEEPAPRVNTTEIALPALQDNRYLGDLAVRIAGDTVSIDANRLMILLRPELTSAALASIEAASVDGRLTIGEFEIEGITVTYNRQLQQIEVASASTTRELRVLQLGFGDDPLQVELEKPSNFSMFVTPTITTEYVWEGAAGLDDGFAPVRGTVDIGGRIGGEKGIAFISRHSFQTGTDGVFSRDETQLIYDILPRVLRLTAGDLRPRGASFQSIPAIGGVSVERFFELEPNRLFRPVGQSTFQLERPSTVEVRINGVIQREIFLQPGRYDLRDLPLVQGSNLVDLVIRDDTGRERIISDRNFFDFDLLEPGITDFSAAVGVKSNFGTRAPNYSNDPVFSGFARRGLSSSVTVGADIQADGDGANGGVSVLWASPIGAWRLEAAASQRDTYGSGFATTLGYRATGDFGEGWQWTFDASGQYFSNDFATISDEPRSPNGFVGPVLSNQPVAAIFNASFQATGPLWSINGAASYSRGRAGRPDTSTAIAGANYALTSSWTAGIFGRYIDDGFEKDTGVIFQLTWRPSRNTDVRARYDTARREAEVRYRKTATRAVGSLTYGVNAIRNDDQDTFDLSGDAFYTGNRFEATARHDVTADASFGSERTQRSQIVFGTSFVFAGGKLGVSRPVRDTFAIFSPHKSIKDKEIRVDPTETGFSAKTDFLGPAINVDMVPFSRRAIYVDVLDLPPGYDLGSGQFAVRPPLFSGYNLTVGSGASYTIIGDITGSDGEPLVYLGGRLESLDTPDAKPIPAFTNRKGRLAATGIKPGRYKLILFTDPQYTQEIEISEDGPSLLNIGQIEVPTP